MGLVRPEQNARDGDREGEKYSKKYIKHSCTSPRFRRGPSYASSTSLTVGIKKKVFRNSFTELGEPETYCYIGCRCFYLPGVVVPTGYGVGWQHFSARR